MLFQLFSYRASVQQAHAARCSNLAEQSRNEKINGALLYGDGIARQR